MPAFSSYLSPAPDIRPMAVVLGVLVVFVLAQNVWGADLSAYHWKHRLLLIFAPNGTDPRLVAFEERTDARRGDMQDRDLLSFRILETGPSGRPGVPMTSGDVEALRRRYKAPAGRFIVILIGKDGGVKLVQEERISLQAIFDLIDTMPMRRREMRQKDAARNTINGQ